MDAPRSYSGSSSPLLRRNRTRHRPLKCKVNTTGQEALVDIVTVKCYAEALRKCGSSKSFLQGKRIHSELKSRGYDSNTFLCNLLVQMYGRCNRLQEAQNAFDSLPIKNVHSWTILILAYLENSLYRDALQVYKEMKDEGHVKPDNFIFSAALSACRALGSEYLEAGRAIHLDIAASRGGRGDARIVSTGLLDMYSKCGSVEQARNVFEHMPYRDVVAWGAMITAYCEQGEGKSTLEMFRKMELEGMKPNEYLYSAVLDACSLIGALSEGQTFHQRVISVGLETHLVVATALVTMYSRCGRMQEARAAFEKVKNKDLVCWNMLVAGYAQHGHIGEVLQIVTEMSIESWELDFVTFNNMLHACSHTGLVDQGRNFFMSMKTDHRITPHFDHFARMIDILGRAGWISQAEELVHSMPFEPNYIVWTTLLSSYQKHGRVERAEHVSELALKLEPANPRALIILLNIYAKSGRWDDVSRVRLRMQRTGWKKLPGGESYVGIKNMLYEFKSVATLTQRR